eukprot:Clim_evm20s161 gene=Clim_evmTU20s161
MKFPWITLAGKQQLQRVQGSVVLRLCSCPYLGINSATRATVKWDTPVASFSARSYSSSGGGTTKHFGEMVHRQIEEAKTLVDGAKTLVAFSGAGLSAESGLATFRDTETHALWSRFDPHDLASPHGFAQDPQLVTEWYNWRRQTLANVKPNDAHKALGKCDALISNVTQNVDDLLERGGVSGDNVHHLHGSLLYDHCNNHCGHSEMVDLSNPPNLRDCPRCGRAPMRPSVVWFGESLPSKAWAASERLCREADVLLVVGTSATVYPAAGLIDVTRIGGGKVVVFNTNPSQASDSADVEIIGPCGQYLPLVLESVVERAEKES